MLEGGGQVELLKGVWMPELLSKLIRSAEEFYKNPENERAFQEWLAQRQREQKEGNNAQLA